MFSFSVLQSRLVWQNQVDLLHAQKLFLLKESKRNPIGSASGHQSRPLAPEQPKVYRKAERLTVLVNTAKFEYIFVDTKHMSQITTAKLPLSPNH